MLKQIGRGYILMGIRRLATLLYPLVLLLYLYSLKKRKRRGGVERKAQNSDLIHIIEGYGFCCPNNGVHSAQGKV
jgi:hypothetical protein